MHVQSPQAWNLTFVAFHETIPVPQVCIRNGLSRNLDERICPTRGQSFKPSDRNAPIYYNDSCTCADSAASKFLIPAQRPLPHKFEVREPVQPNREATPGRLPSPFNQPASRLHHPRYSLSATCNEIAMQLHALYLLRKQKKSRSSEYSARTGSVVYFTVSSVVYE